MKIEKQSNLFIYCGVTAIITYIVNAVILGLLYPNYSHISQFVSELGMINAPHSVVFGVVLILIGVLFILSSIGIYFLAFETSKKKLLSILSALCIALFGVSFLFAGIFPFPDMRHNGFGLGMFILLTPIFLAWTFLNIPRIRSFSIFNLIAFIILIIVMILGGLYVSDETKGLFQRIFVGSGFTWLTITYGYFIRMKIMHNTCEPSSIK